MAQSTLPYCCLPSPPPAAPKLDLWHPEAPKHLPSMCWQHGQEEELWEQCLSHSTSRWGLGNTQAGSRSITHLPWEGWVTSSSFCKQNIWNPGLVVNCDMFSWFSYSGACYRGQNPTHHLWGEEVPAHSSWAHQWEGPGFLKSSFTAKSDCNAKLPFLCGLCLCEVSQSLIDAFGDRDKFAGTDLGYDPGMLCILSQAVYLMQHKSVGLDNPFCPSRAWSKATWATCSQVLRFGEPGTKIIPSHTRQGLMPHDPSDTAKAPSPARSLSFLTALYLKHLLLLPPVAFYLAILNTKAITRSSLPLNCHRPNFCFAQH